MDLRALKVITPLLLLVGFVLTAALHVPGLGVEVNGATRWIGVAGLQFQPSELLKLGVVLYAVQTLAARPSSLRTLGGLVKPLGLVVAAACLLLMVQPDLGTAMVVAFAVGALLIAAGAKIRHLALIVVVAAGLILLLILVEPYRRERLFAFIDPWADPEGSGFQIVQSMIAIGSGGLFGVGLGESVQKIFYLPEAHTDMILAIVGEEVGVLGIMALVALYGMIAYAGSARGQGGSRPLLRAAGGGDHVIDPRAGLAQPLRGHGPGAAHGRAAALHVVRPHQPRGPARGDGAAAERGLGQRDAACAGKAPATAQGARWGGLACRAW